MHPSKLREARTRLATTLQEPTTKGWRKATLEALGVGLDGDGRYVFPLANALGESCGAVLYADNGRTPKAKAEPGTVRELWPRPEDVTDPALFVVEGEPDAVSMAELGYPAVALPGVGKASPDWPERIAAGRFVVYCVTDADASGRTRMRDMAERIAHIGVDAYVLDLAPERDDGYDVGDLLRDDGAEFGRMVLDSARDAAVPVAPPLASPEPEPEPMTLAEYVATSTEVVFKTLDDVKPERVRWLWKPYVPLGKVTILAGAPGLGKSQLTALLAANVTRASFWDTDQDEPANAVILSAEDDPADTVVPRLMAANADLRRVEAISVRKTYPGAVTVDGTIKLPGNVGDLARRLADKTKPHVRLVVFDPVASFFGRDHSTHSNQDVRDLLDPLVALAAHYGVAIVLVLHLNKSDAKTWAEKIAESHGFQAVARSVLVLAPDPDAEEEDEDVARVLAIPKLNLARAASFALRCKIEGTVVTGHDGEPIDTARIKLLGRVDTPADDLLLPSEFGERTARDEAAEFLREQLTDRWLPVAELKARAIKAGVGWRSVERVRRVHTKRQKEPGVPHGKWWVTLKATTLTLAENGRSWETLAALGAQGNQDNPTPPDSDKNNVAALFPRSPRSPRPPRERTKDERRAIDRMLGEDDDDEGA